MKRILKSVITTIASLVGVIGGAIWAAQSGWDWEPVILMTISTVQVISFIILRAMNEPSKNELSQPVVVPQSSNQQLKSETAASPVNRESIVELMKVKMKILFIDDDKNFNVVKILKHSGWKNTKTVTDLKNLDAPYIKETDVFFVDINGVGKQLNLEHQGLDLALMLKQKYPAKKVVIYSANKNSNSFHSAWEICDFKLEKNALPHQFQNLVEEFSVNTYRARK